MFILPPFLRDFPIPYKLALYSVEFICVEKAILFVLVSVMPCAVNVKKMSDEDLVGC